MEGWTGGGVCGEPAVAAVAVAVAKWNTNW